MSSPPRPPAPSSYRSHATSEMAKEKARYADLSAKYDSLNRAYQRAQQRVDEMHGDLKRYRNLSETQARELAHVRSGAQRLLADKRHAEADAKEKSTYAKRIEQKLAVGAKGRYLAEQNHTLRGQVKSLRKELDNAQVLVLARTAELQKASQEIEVLARALELRAEDLSLDGSLRSGLLYEVAQRKEEARRLALEVAAKNSAIADLEDAAADAARRTEVAQARCADLESQAAARDEEIERLTARVVELEAAAEKTEQERAYMLDYVQEQAEQNADLKRRLDEAVREADERRAATEEAERHTGVRIAELEAAKRELEQRVVKLEAVRNAAEQELRRERDRGREAVSRGEKSGAQLSLLQEENARLHSDLDAAHRRLTTLESASRSKETDAAHARTELEDVKAEATQWKRKYDANVAESRNVEEALRGELETTLGQLQSAMAELKDAKGTVKETAQREAQLMMEKKELEDKLESLGSQVDGLSHGKQLLQRTMLSQMGHLRDSLAQSEEERARLQARLRSTTRELHRAREAAGLPAVGEIDDFEEQEELSRDAAGSAAPRSAKRPPSRSPASTRSGRYSEASASVSALLASLPPDASSKEKAAALIKQSLARTDASMASDRGAGDHVGSDDDEFEGELQRRLASLGRTPTGGKRSGADA